MAWIRTAVSMIGFGFTLYKFLQYLDAEKHVPDIPPEGARNLGLTFIVLGLLSLSLAVAQHWRRMRRFDPSRRPFGLTEMVAGCVALIGVLAFLNMVFRIGPF
jgi:putative membrane protein